MGHKKKVLFIAYIFPPIPYGGTYRALRLCRGFSEHDIACHVVTLKEYEDIPNDYDLLKRIPDSVIVHRVPSIDPWRKYQKIKKNCIHICVWSLSRITCFFGFRLRCLRHEK